MIQARRGMTTLVPTPAPLLLVLVLLFLARPTPSKSTDLCSESFLMAARTRNITRCKQLRMLGAELGWHVSSFNSQWTQIDVMFGARLRSDTGWLAWGVNPLPQPQMVGTRAIVGIRQPNGPLSYPDQSLLSIDTYNITSDTKIGCRLLPTPVDVEVRNTTSAYIKEKQFFTISAVVIVPDSYYNVSKLNHVWQVGYEADGAEPKMHPKTLQNFDSAETLNLLTGRSENVAQKNEQSYRRKVHGILNIIGWGMILPIGVIIARYFRKYPFHTKAWWYYLHISCQIVGYSVGTAGWATGLILGANSDHYTFHTHRLLSIFIFTFTTMQMLALRLRPEVTDEYRKYWNMYHHFLGYGLLAVIVLNIFHGIFILKPNYAIWYWVYIGILVVISAVALSLEIYSWIKFIKEHRKSKRNKHNRLMLQSRSADTATHPASHTAK